jgi:hypothetical protein
LTENNQHINILIATVEKGKCFLLQN